jgi:hypothetical protein
LDRISNRPAAFTVPFNAPATDTFCEVTSAMTLPLSPMIKFPAI